jgi:hypothetical protein
VEKRRKEAAISQNTGKRKMVSIDSKNYVIEEGENDLFM